MSLSIAGHLQGLHFPLMCLITHRGYRLMATAVLPIDSSTIVYGFWRCCWFFHASLTPPVLAGSSNAAQSIHAAPHVKGIMEDAAALLNVAEHTVVSTDGRQQLRLHACTDIEVHEARDGRLYILDTHRIMPPTLMAHRRRGWQCV